MSENQTVENKCPVNLETFNFQNIILLILLLKTIWGSLNSNTPEFNLEDLVLNKLYSADNILPTNILNPRVINSNNLIPHDNLIPSRNLCQPSFSLYKLIFLGFLVYIIFFIKDIIEQIGKNDEDNDTCKRCPFKFC